MRSAQASAAKTSVKTSIPADDPREAVEHGRRPGGEPRERGGDRSADERSGLEPGPTGRPNRRDEQRDGKRHLPADVRDRRADGFELRYEQHRQGDVDGGGEGHRQERHPQPAQPVEERLPEAHERHERIRRDHHEQHGPRVAVLLAEDEHEQSRAYGCAGRGEWEREEEQQPERPPEAGADPVVGTLAVERREGRCDHVGQRLRQVEQRRHHREGDRVEGELLVARVVSQEEELGAPRDHHRQHDSDRQDRRVARHLAAELPGRLRPRRQSSHVAPGERPGPGEGDDADRGLDREHAGDAAVGGEHRDRRRHADEARHQAHDRRLAEALHPGEGGARQRVEHADRADDAGEEPGIRRLASAEADRQQHRAADQRRDEMDSHRPEEEPADELRPPASERLADEADEGAVQAVGQHRRQRQRDEGDEALPAHVVRAEEASRGDRDDQRVELRHEPAGQVPEPAAQDGAAARGIRQLAHGVRSSSARAISSLPG